MKLKPNIIALKRFLRRGRAAGAGPRRGSCAQGQAGGCRDAARVSAASRAPVGALWFESGLSAFVREEAAREAPLLESRRLLLLLSQCLLVLQCFRSVTCSEREGENWLM